MSEILLSRVLYCAQVVWPSGLRRWFKAPVTSVAWVRIPPLSNMFYKAVSNISEAVKSYLMFFFYLGYRKNKMLEV